MKKRVFGLLMAVLMVVAILPMGIFAASAGSYGIYTYDIVNREAVITGCDTYVSGKITIPSSINGYPVTVIGEAAFAYCNALKEVVIPDSVKEIGVWAFCCCTDLNNVSIGTGVKTICKAAFQECVSLSKIVIPGNVETIGDSAFYGCKKLSVLKIGSGVKTIGEFAFVYCDSITSVTIPASLTSIGKCAFEYCYNLSEIAFEKDSKLKSIGGYAFTLQAGTEKNASKKLQSITIPKSVTEMGDWIFSNREFLVGNGTMYGYTTLAENYAKKYGIKFVMLGANDDDPNAPETEIPGGDTGDTEYTVKFVCNGVTVKTVVGVIDSDVIRIPEINGTEKSGYNLYWKNSADGKLYKTLDIMDYNFKKDVTFTAVYEKIPGTPESYTISFSYDGIKTSQNIESGETIKLPNVTKDGYKLLYWKNNANDVTYSPSSEIKYDFKKDVTFTAVFEKIPDVHTCCTVTFKMKNGTVSHDVNWGEKIASKLIPNNKAEDLSGFFFLFTPFIKFKGWTTVKNGNLVTPENMVITNDTVFYAKYTLFNIFTLNYR